MDPPDKLILHKFTAMFQCNVFIYYEKSKILSFWP